jgi:hypothetical protein
LSASFSGARRPARDERWIVSNKPTLEVLSHCVGLYLTMLAWREILMHMHRVSMTSTICHGRCSLYCPMTLLSALARLRLSRPKVGTCCRCCLNSRVPWAPSLPAARAEVPLDAGAMIPLLLLHALCGEAAPVAGKRSVESPLSIMLLVPRELERALRWLIVRQVQSNRELNASRLNRT